MWQPLEKTPLPSLQYLRVGCKKELGHNIASLVHILKIKVRDASDMMKKIGKDCKTL